jgi:hypothetical protein
MFFGKYNKHLFDQTARNDVTQQYFFSNFVLTVSFGLWKNILNLFCFSKISSDISL